MFLSTFLIALACLEITTYAENVVCPTIIGTNGLIWLGTATNSTSTPLCLNENHEVLHRKCDFGLWSPEPQCTYVQKMCPDGFAHSAGLCYQILDPGRFPVRCAIPGSLPFNSYINELTIGVPIWVPVQKHQGGLYWVEPTSVYKTPFELSGFQADDHDCVVFDNNSMESVSCYDKHYGLCAYNFSYLNTICTNSCDVIFTKCTQNCPVDELSLQLHYSNQTFTLTVNNSLDVPMEHFLIYCFTNANPSSILHRFSFKINHYVFASPWKEPGEYWCEAITAGNSVSKSNTILLYDPDNTLEFVGIFELTERKNFTTTQEFIDWVISYLTQALELPGYHLRVMKILDKFAVNIHFTSYDTLKDDEEYAKLKNSIQQSLNSTRVFKLRELRAVSFCPSEHRKAVFWGKTKAGHVNELGDLCLNALGLYRSRECIYEEFTEGAYWESIDDCTLIEKSNLTKALFHFDGEDLCQGLAGLTKNMTAFTPIDLKVLVAQLFKCVEETDAYLEVLFIFDNLMRIQPRYFEQAQDALDSLLQTFLFFTYQARDLIPTIALENLVFTKDSLKKIQGVFVRKTGENSVSDSYLDEIFTPDLDSAIFLNATSNSTGAFTIIFTDSLFVQTTAMPKTPTRVFSASFVDQTLPNDIWVVQQWNAEHHQHVCVSWTFGELGGFWRKTSVAELYNDFLRCKFEVFESSSFYSIVPVRNSLSENLSDLLTSEVTAEEVLRSLVAYSERAQDLSSLDLHLIARILDNVSKAKIFDLVDLVQTVSNLQGMDPEVVKTSSKSVDLILDSVSRIINDYDFLEGFEIGAPNFLVLGTKPGKEIFGVTISDKLFWQKYHLNVLENLTVFTEELAYNSFDLVIVFDSSFREYFETNDKIIVTLFRHHEFFGSDKRQVFGVSLPNFEKSSDHFYVLQKLYKDDSKNCFQRVYNLEDQIDGFWYELEQPTEVLDFLLCRPLANFHFAFISQNFDAKNFSSEVYVIFLFFVLSQIAIFGIINKNPILRYLAINHVLQFLAFLAVFLFYRNVDKICSRIEWLFVHYFMIISSLLTVGGFLEDSEISRKLQGLKTSNSIVFGWVFTVLLLVIPASVDLIQRNVEQCLPTGKGLYIYIFIPISIFFNINSCIFTYYVQKINPKCRPIPKKMSKFLNLMLFILCVLEYLANFDYMFCVYLFCIVNSVQGFMIFIVN